MREARAGRWTRRVGLAALSVFVGFPLYAMLLTSVQPLRAARDAFRWLPSHLTFAPYRDMWSTVPLGRYFANSAIVSTASALLAVVVAVPAAYALARCRFRGARAFGLAVLGTQLVPGTLFLVPTFLGYAELRRGTGVALVGSYPGLVLIDLTFALPLSIWLLVAYLDTLPRELEEAALVDGAGPLTVLLRIMLPVAAPGVVAVGTFAFAVGWGEMLFASVLTDDRTVTLPVGLQAYSAQFVVAWNQLFAAALVASLPVLGVFVGLRRYLLRGLVPRT